MKIGPCLGPRAGAVAAGLALDALFGEPPPRLHPVGKFGRGMSKLEQWLWADNRSRGVGYTVAGVGAATTAAGVAEDLVGPTTALAATTAICAAGRSLFETAMTVGELLEQGDLAGARREVRALVGRDSEDLDEKEVARAVIESVAENLTDAVVGTVFWGLIGGARGAAAHRAANMMDAMVGHRTDRHNRFGWASARLDDLVNWPPARLTAFLVALVSPNQRRNIWTTIRRDAKGHPSPNAGMAEAAFAAALGIRLGGTNRYGDRLEVRNYLGDGRSPEPSDIVAAVALGRRVVLVLGAILIGLSLLGTR